MNCAVLYCIGLGLAAIMLSINFSAAAIPDFGPRCY
jgi:hypothetical protein